MSITLNDLPSLSVRRPVLVTVLNLLIIVAGFAAMMGIEVRELPNVDRPFVTVRANLPGASPETLDAEVTNKLESAVARVSGVLSINASSEENEARIRIEFRPGADLDAAASDVREAVSRAERNLPDAVENVTVIKADSDAQSVVSVAVSSETLSREQLTRRVETDIEPALLSIDGVAEVSTSGNRQQVLRVTLDPLRLSTYGISILDIQTALRNAPFDVPAGSMNSVDQQLIIRADATADSAELVEDIMINENTRLGDVANVFFGPADAQSLVRLDGKSVVGVGIIRQASSNTIEISDQVLAKINELDNRFSDLDITVTSDDAIFIRNSVNEVVNTLVLTILLVVLTLWMFIGSFRTTIIPALSIPVALIGVISVIWAMGFSINILTLLALVLATGLIVDDAIVVVENIQRRRSEGLGRRAAAVIGSREVFFAVIATTAVLVSVFVPIAFMPSTVGRLFREFATVLAGTVIISSFVALSLVPAFTSKLNKKEGNSGAFKLALQNIGNRFLGYYNRSLSFVLGHRLVVLAVAIVAASGAALLAGQIKNELLPTEDRGVIRIFGSGPDGVGLNFMDRQAQQMEEILEPYVESGEIDSMYTVVGQWDMNRVLITAPLKNWDERDYTQQELMAKMRQPLSEIAGAPARVWGSNSLNLRGQGGGMEFAITGEDYQEIFDLAQEMAAAIEERHPEIGKPDISYQPTQPQIRVMIDRQRASELNVSLDVIEATLRVAINGRDVTDLNVGDQSIPVILQTANGLVNDPSDLSNLYVASRDGNMIPISALSSIIEEGVAAELERYAQRRAIALEVEMSEELSMEEMINEIRALGEEILPEGHSIVFLGSAATFEETSNQVMYTYLLALLVIFLVLAAQFESINSAVIVMLTVPFGMAAAVFSLYITGTSMNVYSQIGLVMLIGLIAKNSILVVEFADQLRDRGESVQDAIAKAASIRLRPIMMTLISTILGALPLILSTGAGAEARNSIGWVVFGGLGIAAVFTLYITPLFYSAIAPFAKARANEESELLKELDNSAT